MVLLSHIYILHVKLYVTELNKRYDKIIDLRL